jgi:hypothetical protein
MLSFDHAPVAQLGEPVIEDEARLRPGERPDRMSGQAVTPGMVIPADVKL